ncbi:MAG: hypothetical protein AAF515_08800 [Pseudomonadota bacterium]
MALCLAAALLAGCQPPEGARRERTAAEPPAQALQRSLDSDSSASLGLADYLDRLGEAARDRGVALHTLPTAAAAELIVLLLDPIALHPRLLVRKKKTALRAASAMRDQPRLELLVGSGFVSLVEALQPLGLLQIDGEMRNPIEEHGYTRILGLRDGRFQILHRREWTSGRFEAALQAGPGVIERGLLDISTRELQRTRYFRSFVATCGDRIAIGASLVPMNLRTLGERFLDLNDSQGLGCDELVNLAGDREAILAIRLGDAVLYHGDPSRKQAVLVGFERVPIPPEGPGDGG